MNYEEHCMTEGVDAVFCNFLTEDSEKKVYQEVTDFNSLRKFMNEKLESYNLQGRVAKMDIVLFKEAIIHITKIYRVINNNKGHCLLVGVGGSGRHSLTRLASFISGMRTQQLSIRSDFTQKDFRNNLKEFYEIAAFAKEKNKTVFIFSDNDVVDESLLEDIQNMLNGGVIPNIYNSEDIARIREEKNFKDAYKKDGKNNESLEVQVDWLYSRIKDNMHCSICMSPVGDKFRNYARMYPALINNTTIDWFMAWPFEALIEVADKFIGQMEGIDKKQSKGLS